MTRVELSQTVLYYLSRALVLLYARAMLKLDVCWQAPLPPGPKLIVANHPSCSDPFFLSVLFRRPIHMLIIDNPFKVPVFGAFLQQSGHIPVVPGNGRPALDAARQLLEAGRSVALFPEGWVTQAPGGFQSPRTGAARLALLTGAPVVPVGIYMPQERCRVITSEIAGKQTVGYWYLRGRYHMTVGQPMVFEGDVEDRPSVNAIAESIMDRITGLAAQGEQRGVPRLALMRRLHRKCK